jgi:regulator of protease activity HflC (stomatin/prohibitin superfamily)
MVTINIDSLLETASRIGWSIYIVYVVALTVRNAIRYGPVRAGLELLTLKVLVPFLLPLLLNLLSLSIVFIAPQEVGVVVSVISPGGIRPQAVRAGLHFIVPILESDAKYPTYWQTYTMSAKPTEGQKLGNDSIRARTSDGQEVLIDTSVIFRIDEQQAVTIYTDWQERYIQDFVRPVIRAIVRRQVSQFTVEEVNSSSRRDLEALLDRLLEAEFSDKGLILDQFLLRDIAFSLEYAAAIEKKQVALEGQQRTEYEAQQVINLAEGNAQAIRLEADARADALKTIAEALAGNQDLLTYTYIEKLAPDINVMLLPSDSPFLFPLPDAAGIASTVTDTIGLAAEVLDSEPVMTPTTSAPRQNNPPPAGPTATPPPPN